ncbi:hypothetical protein [Methanocaldococcus villosus]|uniref:hypothetical protein n=1 Tax=Methanocaldococcus villosus TaxID=667126 RepID=UPI00069484FE|nr:hypothetical protein [Methanocaldococcus villosus]
MWRVDLYINYSPEFLDPVTFNWSDICKNQKIKEFKFNNGSFYLSILFDNPIYEDFILGTLTFVPKKVGITYINISGVVSSKEGLKYDGYNYNGVKYPKTLFYGSEIIIKKSINYSGEKKLNESITNIYQTSSNIINVNVNITANQKSPKIIIKEINISETKPNITIFIKEEDNLDIKLLFCVFLGSILSGVVFGIIIKNVVRI